MDFDGLLLWPKQDREQAVRQIMDTNERSLCYGLQLSMTQAVELAETRSKALHVSGRVEFGPSVVGKLAEAFCDSPYLGQDNYAETLNELVELFFHYKNETGDRVTDGHLIRLMKMAFDGPCRGSAELLKDRTLHDLVRYVKFGRQAGEETDE